MPDVIVVTACDERHDDLAAELLASLTAGERDFAIGFLRMGVAPAPVAIASACDHVVQVAKADPTLTADQGFQAALLGLKARLPQYFPGFATYVWLDADTWLQNLEGVRQLIAAAALADVAAAPESDPNYHRVQSPNDYTEAVYATIYGQDEAKRWSRYPMINGGVLAARAASPLWAAWDAALTDARERQAGRPRRFYSDQIPLHRLIASGAVSLYPLRAVNNWLVLQSPPVIDLNAKVLRAPSMPWEAINILHLVGPSKTGEYPLGDGRMISFRYPRIQELFRGHAAD